MDYISRNHSKYLIMVHLYETSKFKKDYDFGKLHNTRNLVVD